MTNQDLLAIPCICAGACLGALLRWQLGPLLNARDRLAWGTFTANAIGGYSIGLVLAWLDSSRDVSPLWRATLVTGFLGALTTFSSFSAEVVALMEESKWPLATVWIFANVVTSVTLTVAGKATLNGLR